MHTHIADEVWVAARRIDRRRVALDIESAPPQTEHLFDDNALAATGVSESAVEDGNSFWPDGACAPPAADEQESQETKDQCVARSNRVVQDDRAGRDRGAETETAAENQRARDFEAADVARTRRDGKSEQQRGIRGHRLQRGDRHADGPEEQAEVERIDQQGDRGQPGEPPGQGRRPQAFRPRSECEGLAREAGGEALG